MAQRLISYLKSRFATGNKPTQEDFGDVFDSFVHKAEVEQINATVINERINNYDTSLKEVTDGNPSTLGDVLQILSGFSNTDDVKELLDAAGGTIQRGQIQGKPAQLSVVWNEHLVSIATYYPEEPATPEAVKVFGIVRGYGKITQPAVILDINMTIVTVQWLGGNFPNYRATRIQSVIIGVNPRAVIP